MLIKVDGIKIADGVVVQPNAVFASRVLGQRVAAVCSWLAVEADVDGLALGHGGVVGNALEYVQTRIITFAPCYVELVPSGLSECGLMAGLGLTLVLVERSCCGSSEDRGDDGSGELHLG